MHNRKSSLTVPCYERIPGRRPNRYSGLRVGLVTFLLVSTTVGPVRSQTIQGRLVESSTDRSIPGAMMYLLNENGAFVFTTMSATDGAYRVEAPAAGVYRIRAERIGFQSTMSQPIRLGVGEAYSYRMEATTDPVELQAIVVRADEGRCDVRPAEGEAAWALWEEARKALAVTRWTVESGTFLFEQTLFARYVRQNHSPLRDDVADARASGVGPDPFVSVDSSRVITQRVVSANPFTSAPIDSLESRGYAYGPDGEFYYYGPDAEVLLSDMFLASHCFGIRRGRGETEGLVGLRFEPDGRLDRVDVRGVLWLEPVTAELQYIEFEYVINGRSFDEAGGEVNFEKLPSGRFIIRSWALEARKAQPRHTAKGLRLSPGRWYQEGGIVTLVSRRENYQVKPQLELGPPVELVEPHPDISGASPPYPSQRQVPAIVTDALRPYRGPGSLTEVSDILRAEPEFAAANDAWSRTRLSALWRRAGEPERALAALDSIDALDARGPDRGVIALERARALFALGNTEEGGTEFNRACRSLNADVKDELWLDFQGLATPYERETWPDVEPAPVSCALIQAFLIERARRMGVSIEERLQMHYDRLRHVRDQYWLRRPRRQEGLADRLGRPDSLEVDDRGLVYLRLGKWDEWASYGATTAVIPNESWRYDAPAGPIVFHFAPVTRMTAGPGGVADYRLLDNLYMALGTTMQVDLVTDGFLNPASRDLLDPFTEIYLSRMGLDGRYATWAYRARTNSGTGVLADLAKEKEQNAAAADKVVRTVPDLPDLRPRLRFAWQMLRFRNQGSDANVVWFLTSTRTGDLEADDGAYRTRTEIRLRDGGRMPTESVEAEVPADGLDDESGIVTRSAMTLPPGIYPFTLIVRDLNTADPGIGNWTDGEVTTVAISAGLPDISDLAVAADSGGTWTRDGEVFLAVEPSHVTSRDGSIHVYFEVYGLAAAREYDVDLRLVPQDQADRMYAIEPDDVAFRLQFRGSMPDNTGGIGRHHLRLDLSGTESGAYVLAVRVRDAITTTPSLPATTPIVIP